ncbi:carboxypeptidase M32 [Aestuariivirga sp. YIM B02566]|uniref:Carboxypeptidase M32 n=1 Tax=Taklimakanibacter albus TaxID=2800327 RepID=A0ACC5R0U8_9HYPH|nr:carboxypeptidase M32 [Aestuariivirga sp. YIM B02566]MBK1866281.1 carboxypeptidase M32 [Aestuariivirga sp. YIM B02566]
MSFAQIEDLGRKLEALDHAQAMLGVDEAVQMPVGGGEKRAEALSMLAGFYHELATAPEVADWIDAAERGSLDANGQASVREFRRVYTNMTCLSADFVRRQVNARVRCEQLWRELRPKGDWAGFLPAFEGVVALMREEAALRAAALRLAPYDALMEQYDPGNRAADIAPVFAELKAFLKDFVPQAMAHQDERLAKRPLKPFNAPFPIERQKALGHAMMEAVGFDFTHGRLDISHHPFCGGVPSDVRMTTRYVTGEFLSALMGILHETGHGLYEQGLPSEWSHMPVGRARGMAMHESQSLFVEMQVSRSPEFWHWAMPVVAQHLGEEALKGWDVDDVLSYVHRIKPGFIRVDADEATYPLHVILRFEMEQDLVSGKLAAKDIPEAWNAKMTDYLGLSTLDNPKDGPMQDVHWPSGAFGYFPSYTLGALTAAQLWAALERDQPSARDDISNGRFVGLNDWRRRNIWSQASLWSTPDLLERATGERLQTKYFIQHLKRRYLS